MTVSEGHVLGWLAGQLEWERVLTVLYRRAEAGRGPGDGGRRIGATPPAPTGPRAVADDRARGAGRRARLRWRLGSPVRGMSRRSPSCRLRG
jgi:hypothetical protein